SGMVNFLIEQQAWLAANHLKVKLVLKNQDEDMLGEVVKAVLTGRINRNTLGDFHISESDSGDRSVQRALSKKIGIQTLDSDNTYDYDAIGSYKITECL